MTNKIDYYIRAMKKFQRRKLMTKLRVQTIFECLNFYNRNHKNHSGRVDKKSLVFVIMI